MGCQIYFYSGAYNPALKRDLNIDQLFSYYHEPKLVIDTIKYTKEHPEYTAKIMLDSGAFTHYQDSKKKGIVLTDKDIYDYTDKYLEFLNEWGDDLFCFVGVDSVPDPEDVNPNYAQKTWDNYLYMWEKLRPEIRHKLIPVFHYGEDFKWLKNFLEHRHVDGTQLDYIGLAISLEGTRDVRIKWGQECMKIIRNSSNPNVKTHAFGVGVKSVLEHIDVYSTDATSWVKRAAYGMISINDKTIYISEIQRDKCNGSHYTEKNMAYQEVVESSIKDRGFSIDPEQVKYAVDGDTATFTVETGKIEATVENLMLKVKFEGNDEIETYKLDAVEEVEDRSIYDKFFGIWVNGEKNFKFDGQGTVAYDNGLCLATNCYARARFNIIDTETWMKDLHEQKAVMQTKKVNLGW